MKLYIVPFSVWILLVLILSYTFMNPGKHFSYQSCLHPLFFLNEVVYVPLIYCDNWLVVYHTDLVISDADHIKLFSGLYSMVRFFLSFILFCTSYLYWYKKVIFCNGAFISDWRSRTFPTTRVLVLKMLIMTSRFPTLWMVLGSTQELCKCFPQTKIAKCCSPWLQWLLAWINEGTLFCRSVKGNSML